MLTIARQQKILAFLGAHQTARLADLARETGAGLSTVRRDLRQLEEQGLLLRVHGGAHLPANLKQANGSAAAPGESVEPPIRRRASVQAEAKQRIGRAAAALVADGSTIFISSSTTTEAMVPALAARQGLTVITNSLSIAVRLSRFPHIATVVLGGWLRHSELSLLGHLTTQALADLRAEQLFHGIFSLDPERGLAGSNLQEVETDRAILAAARDLIVLADHTKFALSGPVQLAPVERMHTLVTDSQAPAEAVARLRAKGVQVIEA